MVTGHSFRLPSLPLLAAERRHRATGPLHWEGAAQSALPGAQGGTAHTPRAASRENRPAARQPWPSQISWGSERLRPLSPHILRASVTEHGHASALPATPPLGGVREQPPGSLGGPAGPHSNGPLAPAGTSCPAASGHRCRPHKTARGGGGNTHEMARRRAASSYPAARVHACVDTPVGKRTPTPTHVHPRTHQPTHQPISLGAAWDTGCPPPGSSAAPVSRVDPPGAH
uniref:Uncharacterized protein n=1 Tax=Rangifer tarandus platyrhynchus TaxID=3082113 RepID=A0ACB0FEI8_RANTA|nr:unnamed protein product [Rangifer tarandus platyrhynchus]